MEPQAQPERPSLSPWAAAAVTLCGVCAFLELYCTQPLLPLLDPSQPVSFRQADFPLPIVFGIGLACISEVWR